MSEIRVTNIIGETGTDAVNFTKGINVSSGVITATTFSGSGANLTSLPAGNLTGTLPAISGASLTGIQSISVVDHWAISSSFTGNATPMTNWARVGASGDDVAEMIGTGLSESSGIFTFPSTGKWLIHWNVNGMIAATDQSYLGMYLHITTNNSSYSHTAHTYTANGNGYGGGAAYYLMDVTNVSTHKIRWHMLASGGSNTTTQARTDGASTGFMVLRIGDT